MNWCWLQSNTGGDCTSLYRGAYLFSVVVEELPMTPEGTLTVETKLVPISAL